MSKIVTVRLLIDEPDESRLYDGLNEMFRAAQTPIEEDDTNAWLVDYDIGAVVDAPDEIDDSIMNETYVEGEFVDEPHGR